jgi:hypothetical protein
MAPAATRNGVRYECGYPFHAFSGHASAKMDRYGLPPWPLLCVVFGPSWRGNSALLAHIGGSFWYSPLPPHVLVLTDPIAWRATAPAALATPFCLMLGFSKIHEDRCARSGSTARGATSARTLHTKPCTLSMKSTCQVPSRSEIGSAEHPEVAQFHRMSMAAAAASLSSSLGPLCAGCWS